MGFRPKKSLGQVFLKDPEISREIIRRARFTKEDWVFEIGGGAGALTLPLARVAGRVFVIEKDRDVAEILKKRLEQEQASNVTLIVDDILRWDFVSIPHIHTQKIKVIGNLPYYISSPVLEKLILNRHLISRAVLMFQLELAKRIAATPGNKAYGAMTILVQYYARTVSLLEVSKNAFYPIPKIDSMVLDLDFERPYPSRADNDAQLKRIVKGAFSHRRKTLFNSLKGAIPELNAQSFLDALETCGIDQKRRAETLSIDDFLCLNAALHLNPPSDLDIGTQIR